MSAHILGEELAGNVPCKEQTRCVVIKVPFTRATTFLLGPCVISNHYPTTAEVREILRQIFVHTLQ